MDRGVLNLINVLCDRNLHFTVTSAKRTESQNIACKGVKNSQHLTGNAVDIKPYAPTTLSDLLKVVSDTFYDQLILYPTFLHVSYVHDDKFKSPRIQFIRK